MNQVCRLQCFNVVVVFCQLSAGHGSASRQMEGEFQQNGLKGKSSNTQSTCKQIQPS